MISFIFGMAMVLVGMGACGYYMARGTDPGLVKAAWGLFGTIVGGYVGNRHMK